MAYLYDDTTLDTMKIWANEYSGYSKNEILTKLTHPSYKMKKQDKENLDSLADILFKLYAVYDPVRSSIITTIPRTNQKPSHEPEVIKFF